MLWAWFVRRSTGAPFSGPCRWSSARLLPGALGEQERETVRAVLNSARFQDCAPAAIQATLSLV